MIFVYVAMVYKTEKFDPVFLYFELFSYKGVYSRTSLHKYL